MDPIEGLLALGLVTPSQVAAAARIPGNDIDRIRRLAVVGVDEAAMLPALSLLTGIPVVSRALLDTPPPDTLAAAWISATTQTALRALPACPVRAHASAPIDVVVSDPAVRGRVAELLGPTFRMFLAIESDVHALAVRHLPAGSAPAFAVAAAGRSTARLDISKLVEASEPVAPTFAQEEQAVHVEAPRARAAGRAALEGAALAAALAEQVDLSDDEKRRVLELDARIDGAAPEALLDLPAGSDPEDVKQRYYELSRAFHPDAHFRKKLGSYKARINRVFRAFKRACDKMVADAEARDRLDLGAADTNAGATAGPAAGAAAAAPAVAATARAAPSKLKVDMAPERRADTTSARDAQHSAPAHGGTTTRTQAREGGVEFELQDATGDLDLDYSNRGAVSSFHLGAVGSGTATGVTSATKPVTTAAAAPVPVPVPAPTPAAAAEPTATAAAERAAPPRTVSSVRPVVTTAGTAARARKRRTLIAAAAGVLAVVAGIVAILLFLGARARDVEAQAAALVLAAANQQAFLVQQARDAISAGDYPRAIAFASDAMQAVPDTPLAREARVLRGLALLKNGDRAEAFEDLEAMLKVLPAGDPTRASIEDALAKARL